MQEEELKFGDLVLST